MTEPDKERLDIVRSSLKYCPNFPKEGITFVDVFGLFANPKAHRALIDLILNRVRNSGSKVGAIVGLEARGFIFGPQVALELQIPFLPVRKRGKLPGKVVSIDYELEYGKDTIEMQTGIIEPGTKVILVDDLLATGGTLGAAHKLCAKLGYEVVETIVIIELLDMGGRRRLPDAGRVVSLCTFSDDDLQAAVNQNKESEKKS